MRTTGRSAGWPRARACWRRRWPPCCACSPPTRSPTPAALDQALRRATGPHLRPARHRRQLLDQRHRAAAGLGGQRDRPDPGRSRRRRAAGLRRPVRSAASRRRGRHQARHRDRDRCRHRGRRADRRPGDRPRQPGQDRAVRLGPQLGPGAGRRRHGAGRPGSRSNHACRSTVLRCASTAPGRRARARWTCRATDIDVTVDLGVGDGQATIRTTDLSHAYVEENSAYSS